MLWKKGVYYHCSVFSVLISNNIYQQYCDSQWQAWSNWFNLKILRNYFVILNWSLSIEWINKKIIIRLGTFIKWYYISIFDFFHTILVFLRSEKTQLKLSRFELWRKVKEISNIWYLYLFCKGWVFFLQKKRAFTSWNDVS